MLRLEAGYAAAAPLLCIALLQAWSVFETQPFECECRRWLRRISPVCISMIVPGSLQRRPAASSPERTANRRKKKTPERTVNDDKA